MSSGCQLSLLSRIRSLAVLILSGGQKGAELIPEPAPWVGLLSLPGKWGAAPE